jgi:hypothetical protein
MKLKDTVNHAMLLLIFVWNVATQQFVMIVKMGQILNSLMGNVSVLKVIGKMLIKHVSTAQIQLLAASIA